MRHGPVHTVTVVSLSILLGGQSALLHAQATFNMDLLEKNDHLPAVDLQRFNQQAGQPPGAYPVSWQVNGVTLDARKTVTFRQNDRGQLTPCLKPEDLLQAGVNPAVLSQAPGATSRSCPELNALLPGSTVNFDFAHQRLVMTIPQALMTHRARDNVPSALWDEGISAFQSNYRYSGASQRTREGSTERDNYLMLKSGVNVGAWRLRASNSLTANSDDKPQWTTSGAWLERDLTRWHSELTLGDTFTSGDVFDAVQFQGISLASSDAMLPDSQKGFAPTIRGIARTNAQVTVRQNGYVLYQTYVTPGAFVIDDLYPTASSGNLEVAVKESDGEIRRFTQPYASVTSMQREGSLKYNLVAGRYHSDDASQRPLMMQLSLMRGFAHNLTLFGGLQSAAQYHNLSVGEGQGLGEAGALSLQLLNARDRHQQDPIDGRAWQLQYSKGFDRLGTQLTFTGWRYSHQRYATLSEAFSSPGNEDDLQDSDNKKATLQITASQRAFTPTLAIRRCLRCSREDNRCPLAAKYAPKTPTASLPARVRCTWPAWRQKAPFMRNGGRALSSAVAPATISPRRWRRPPIHSFYSRRYHVLFNSPASGRHDAVIYSVTGRQRMGLYASVCPRPGLHPSTERGAAHGSG